MIDVELSGANGIEITKWLTLGLPQVPYRVPAYYFFITPKNYSIASLGIETRVLDDAGAKLPFENIGEIWWDRKNKQYAFRIEISNKGNNRVKIIQNLTITKYDETSHRAYHKAIEEKYHLKIPEVEGKIIDDPEVRKNAFKPTKSRKLLKLQENFQDVQAEVEKKLEKKTRDATVMVRTSLANAEIVQRVKAIADRIVKAEAHEYLGQIDYVVRVDRYHEILAILEGLLGPST
ncbi:MAG: hypothetical protein ACXADX_19175, partial [Candidatus Hodarchaeales archaeon]|jgi:hypothetical protein